MTSSNFRVMLPSIVGSMFDAASTSLNCASFFSIACAAAHTHLRFRRSGGGRRARTSVSASSFFSRSRFLKPDFCCTS
jgi:hypothetical protein